MFAYISWTEEDCLPSSRFQTLRRTASITHINIEFSISAFAAAIVSVQQTGNQVRRETNELRGGHNAAAER